MSAQIITAMNQSRETTTQASAAIWIKMLSVGTLLPLLCLTAAMLAWRRLAGALHEPLDAWSLAITVVILAAASLTVRLLAHGNLLLAHGNRLLAHGNHGANVWARPWLAALILLGPTAAVAATGLALSLPGTSVAGLAMLWTILAVGELSGLVLVRFAASVRHSMVRAWRQAGRIPRAFRSAASGELAERRIRIDAPHEPVNQVIEQPPLRTQADDGPSEATCDAVPERSVTQQVTRLQASDGTETISGWLRASFQPGQRTASVHLAFCPPFSGMPSVEVEQVDGPPGRIKTVQLLPYGARFDLKLFNDAEEPLDVLLQFSARG